MGRVHRWDVVYGVCTFDFLVLHLRVLAELELPDRAADDRQRRFVLCG